VVSKIMQITSIVTASEENLLALNVLEEMVEHLWQSVSLMAFRM